MKKIGLIFVFIIGFSSCRPAYMRCPKGRRCVEKIVVSENKPIVSLDIKCDQF